ncbi:PREDICTED: T-cell surface glycoprotein CD1a-like [Ceratotherium simum simum]|uniref:T-cell surface glycoprotein CD1a-like n=1 Tax=Ceratotherium simum simum TaxID=73337 RepID=A0ABM0IA00_CERSS|nr:PREDICTED: T-cell surface glycoprotein CD1a-like [Ceratotherium simum simum]
MLFLQLRLLAVLLPGGDNKDGKNTGNCPLDFQDPVSFQIIQISSFYNHSWVQNLGSGWLGELQTHRWENNSGTIIFMWPWSKGNFKNEEKNEEWMELEKLFRVTSIAYLQAAHNFANQWKLEYPFELQMVAGCELHFGEGSVGFMCIAYQGSDYLSLENNSFLPSPKGGSKAQHVCRLLNDLLCRPGFWVLKLKL